MNRPLRTIIAVGMTLIGVGAASAKDDYFDCNYNRFPQRYSGGLGCPRCRAYANPDNLMTGGGFGCEQGIYYGRGGRYRFDADRYPVPNASGLGSPFIPNRPPVNNYREFNDPSLFSAPPIAEPSRFRSEPRLSKPSLPPLTSQQLVIPPKQKGIANLPPVEQKVALKQGICPITREPLGSMGTPIKVQVGDRSIYVCCQGCVSTLLERSMNDLPKAEKSPEARQIR